MSGIALAKAMLGRAHAHVVPDAGDGHPGILIQKRHSDFVACPVCDELYEWGSNEPKFWITEGENTAADKPERYECAVCYLTFDGRPDFDAHREIAGHNYYGKAART